MWASTTTPRCIASLVVGAALLIAPAALAGRWVPFTYTNDRGLVRVCKGDSTTGESLCTNFARAWGKVKGVSAPKLSPATGTEYLYLKYDSPFSAKGEAGRYEFFRYYNDKGAVRICVGDTAEGSAVCRDGTAYSATVRGLAEPRFTASKNVSIRWFKFFHFSKKGAAGTYAFTTYRNDKGLVRVCQQHTGNGAILCQDFVAFTASTRGPAAPKWVQSDKTNINYLEY